MADDDAMALLMGDQTPSATFPEVGSQVKGEVLALDKSQQRDFKSKEPKTWPDGQPMMQVVVTLQTELNDGSPEDDGKRKLYVAKRSMREAVRAAITRSGHTGSLIGGTLAVRRDADGEAEPGLSAPHNYAAQYAPPPATEPFDDEEPF